MSDRDIESWDKRLADQERRGWENYLRRRINLDTARELDLCAITGEFIYVEDVSSADVTASIRLNGTSNDPIDLQLATRIKTIFTQVFISHPAQAGEWIDLVWGINFEYQKEHAIDIAQPVSVDDNGGSLTVDDGGGALTVDGVLIVTDGGGSLTVDGAVSVDDGGGVLTVDGTVAVSSVGGTVTVVDGGGTISIDDGGGVLTVDGTVAVSSVAGTVTTDDKEGNAQPCITITNVLADTNTVGAANACKVALIRAHTTNTGLVWINCGAAAVDGSCYPLAKGDAVSFRTTNTNQINALFKVANEKVTVLYQN